MPKRAPATLLAPPATAAALEVHPARKMAVSLASTTVETSLRPYMGASFEGAPSFVVVQKKREVTGEHDGTFSTEPVCGKSP